MSLIVNVVPKKLSNVSKPSKTEPLSINNLLNEYKIATLKNVINKFNKLYTLCKSKKIDKLPKNKVASHRLNTVIKKRVTKSLQRNNKRRINKCKRKLRNKGNKRDCNTKEEVIQDEDDLRYKIREQLDLLRNFKKTNPPLLTLKTKSISKNESSIDNENNNKSEVTQPLSPKPGTSFDQYEIPVKRVSSPENIFSEENIKPQLPNGVPKKCVKADSLEISFSLIKPTKTNDITKIKGWRGKQFSKTIADALIKSSIKDKIDESMDLPQVPEISSKSAFESEALDKFLTNAKLNISYEIPKLIAEEAISKIEDFKVLSRRDENQSFKQIAKISDKKCKAKTLAEKRKMIENDRQKDLLHEMEINETTLLKQLKRDEKRHRVETINEIRNTLKNQSMPISRDCWKTAMRGENNRSMSQVIINGNENIQITGSYGEHSILLRENHYRDQNKNLFLQNVRIIDEINFKAIKDNRDHYKPGPLSRKPTLSKHKNNVWETVVVTLPKVILEVHSECGKEINPKILPYLQAQVSEQGFISNVWANFAASAVHLNRENVFDFPLSYVNDQHKVLMKKKKIAEKLVDDELQNDEKLAEQSVERTVESEVKVLMNDIIKYLETPVLDNTNIEYCPDCPKFEESHQIFVPTTQIPDDVHTILSASRKRKLTNLLKTERELKRLSVQVIEVDMQTETKAKRIKNEKCMKAECQMGCVCFDSDVEWPQHCGKEACLLQCQCRSIKMVDKQRGHQYISLPEGSNLLSAKTMGHIRDQANRNLAKEERKFTQTVIKANDQTIVVGEGCRERRKRVKKVPQKYTEYVKDNEELKKILNVDKSTNEQATKKSPNRSLRMWGDADMPRVSNGTHNDPPAIFKQEIVPIVENMVQLKSVLPWCMIHHLYKCFCKGHALEDILTQKTKKTAEKDEENDDNYIAYTSKRTYAAANPFANAELNVCARIRGVPNFYLNRNKSQYFKTRNIEIRDKERTNNYFDFVRTDTSKDSVDVITESNHPIEFVDITTLKNTESFNFKAQLEQIKLTAQPNGTNSSEIIESSRSVRRKTISKKYSNNEFIAEFKKIPEKENIVVKKDTKKDKKSLNEHDTVSSTTMEVNGESSTSSKLLIKPPDSKGSLLISKTCTLPDLLVPMPHIQNHFRSMVFKNASLKHIFRLMHWEKLNEHFHNSSIYIWYNPKGVSGKLIATNLKTDRPSADYIDVKYFKNMTTELPDVVKGLVQGKLPGRMFDSKNTYGIFVFNGQSWEIRGTILKKPTDSPIINEEIEKSEVKKVEKLPEKPNIIKELHLESKEVPLTVAEPELHVDKDTATTPASIRVPIPIGAKDSRWFMLILENDFSVLRITKSPVLVKYAQLKQACQFAMRVARTVRFLIPRNDKPHDSVHPAFGGYAVPGLLERVFFGPYDLVEPHGILTYRYLNGKLVDTKEVERLTGAQTKKSKGIWLYTKGGSMVSIKSPIQGDDQIPIVDLTEHDDGEVSNQNWDSVVAIKSVNDTSKVNFEKLEPPIDSVTIFPCNNATSSKIPLKGSSISLLNKTANKPAIPNSYPSNKIDKSMPVLEKIDHKINVGKSNKEMPTLQPIASSTNKISAPIENEILSTNQLPMHYAFHKAAVIKRKRKSQLQEICNDDDLEIISTTISTKPKERTMWLLSEPRNLGYIEIKTHLNGKIGLKSPINQQDIQFNEMSAAIDWIDKLLRRFVHFVPMDFQIRMFLIEDEKALMNRQPLRETELRGHHVICKKGLFDLTELTSVDIDDLGISIRERDKLLERQPTLILQKYIYKLGDTFLPVETMRSMLHETIINMASPAIRRLQKENIKLKKLKRDFLLENQRLQNKLNELSKKIENGTMDVDTEDDDVIIIEEDEDIQGPVKNSLDKDPLELPGNNDLIISNVTSLADNYVQNDAISEKKSKIIDGKVKKLSKIKPKPMQQLLSTTTIQSLNSVVDPIQKLSIDQTKSPVYAPVLLPDGRSILIPIEPSNSDTKLVVSDNQSKKYKIRITPVPSRKKPVSLLNNSLKCNSQQNSAIAATPPKDFPAKSSLLKSNANSSDTSTASSTITEIIEID